MRKWLAETISDSCSLTAETRASSTAGISRASPTERRSPRERRMRPDATDELKFAFAWPRFGPNAF